MEVYAGAMLAVVGGIFTLAFKNPAAFWRLEKMLGYAVSLGLGLGLGMLVRHVQGIGDDTIATGGAYMLATVVITQFTVLLAMLLGDPKRD